MIRTLAHDIAYIAALEVLPYLGRAIDGPVNITPYRQPLEKVADRLQRALLKMQEQGIGEDAEDAYLPIFDSMMMLRSALRMKIIDRSLVERANDQLLMVKRKGGAA